MQLAWCVVILYVFFSLVFQFFKAAVARCLHFSW